MSGINTALLQDFIDESREHLDEMESLLLQLGSNLDNLDLLNDIFRTMHNIKGTSQLTGLDKISRLSHRLEDLLDLLRKGDKETTAETVILLISGRDKIVKLVSELEQSQQELTTVDELIAELNILIEGSGTDTQDAEQAAHTNTSAEESTSVTQASTSNPDYEEDDDEELFNIFHEHLKEQFSLLSSYSAHFRRIPPEPQHLLECKDAVNRLKSSANYMGYDDMVDFLGTWSNSLEDAYQAVLRDETVLLDFMENNLDDLANTFPQLERSQATGLDIPAEATTKPVVVPEDDTTSAVLDAFREMEAEDNTTSAVLDAFSDEDEPQQQNAINHSIIDNFIDEAREHLDEMEPLLFQLENDPGNTDVLTEISRTTHNIRNAAQLSGFDKIPSLAHRLEDLLDSLRQGQNTTDTQTLEALVAGRDLIALLINELEETHHESSSVEELIEQLTSLIDKTTQISDEVANQEAASPDSMLTIPNYEEEHDKELFGIFISHLREHLADIISYLGQTDNATYTSDTLDKCIPAIHRLHSSANYMGYDELTHFYDTWETELANAINSISLGEAVPTDLMANHLDKLIKIFPQLGDIEPINAIDNSSKTHQPTKDNIISQVPDIREQAETIPAANTTDKTDKQEDELYNRLNSALNASLQNVSRSEHETLNEVFDELISSQDEKTTKGLTKAATGRKVAPRQQQNEQPPTQQRPRKEAGEKKIRKSVRVDAEKIDALMNQVGELVVDRSYFFQLFNEMRELQQHLKESTGINQKDVKLIRAFTYRLSEAISALGRTSNELQEGVMKMRMLPVSHLFNRYPRLVHDLTNNSDKKVNLVLRGEDTELDKMIVEELSDPLIHIIRNAIDHGIETTEERQQKGKDVSGKLILEAYQESNHIVIEVTDDGRGLSPGKIKEKAVSNELYTHDEVERMNNREVLNLILMPGFSTAEKITDTSGRGVGMDVVKKNIEKLNGTLDIDSIPEKGTQMRLKIPLTLAIIHALMVRVGTDMFTIPLANVDETVRISRDDTSMVEGVEIIHLRGIALPVFRLSNLFKVSADQNIDKSFVVIVNTDGQRIGFVVDELLGQQEVVIKPLEDYVQERSGFSGATIVGDGRISLIIDVYELVKMTTNKQIQRHKQHANMLKLSRKKLVEKSESMSDRLH